MDTQTPQETPKKLLNQCWTLIKHGIQARQSNYHTMSVHYITSTNIPRSVIMIPRSFDDKKHILRTHTDFRSPKVQHLKNNPHVSLLFWCREQKTQMILTGKVTIAHTNHLTKSTWKNMQNMSKVCYCADIAPGTQTMSPSSGFSLEQWQNRKTIVDTEFAYNNFAMVCVDISSVERLDLSASGHQKIIFRITEQKDWTHEWLSP